MFWVSTCGSNPFHVSVELSGEETLIKMSPTHLACCFIAVEPILSVIMGPIGLKVYSVIM
jgi:hypothetical protein